MQPFCVVKSQLRGALWRLWVVVLLAGTQAVCQRGTTSLGVSATAPSVNMLPSEVADQKLTVSGRRPPNTRISARFADGAVQLLAIAGDTQNTVWSGVLHLADGNNAFVLLAEDAAGNVSTSAPYNIVVNPATPKTPSVDVAYQSVAFLYTTEGSIPALSGQKDANTSIEVDGALKVGLDSNTRWRIELPNLTASTPVQLRLSSTNRAGQTSPALSLEVHATQVPPVQLDAVASLTNAPVTSLTGGHQLGAVVHAIWQGQSVDASVTAPDATHFALSLPLAATGIVDGVLQAVVYQSIAEQQGPFSVVPITYDVVPPLAPLVWIPADFAQNAPDVIAGHGAPASLSMTGSLPEPNTTLCVGLGSLTPCQITQGPADVFALSVPLHPGDNVIVLSSVDAAGNHSQALLGHTYVTSPPAFVVDSPKAQDILSGEYALILGHMYLSAADANVPSAAEAMALAAVDVCIDDVNCRAAEVQNGVFSCLMPLASLNSGSHTITLQGTTRSGAQYTADTPSSGQIAVNYFSARPNWLNGAQNEVLGARAPQLAVDAYGTAHIVWEDFCPNLGDSCPVAPTGNVGPDIFYTSRDAAGLWAKTVQSVSTNGAADGQSRTPSIAIDSAGLVHVAWSDNGSIVQSPNNNYGILHRTLDPLSGAWSRVDVVAGQDGHHAKQPKLAPNTYSQAAGVHLTWQREATASTTSPVTHIFYARLQATLPVVANMTFGTWSAPLNVTADANTGWAAFPDLAQGPDGHVGVVWQECRAKQCTNSPPMHAVRMMDIADANTLDALGSVVINDSLTDGDGVQPRVACTPDNSRHIVWQGLSETGGANPNVSAIFGRAYRGRTPDSRLPSALWLSQGQSSAARAPWVTGRADGHFAIAWSQATSGSGRRSRVAVRLGTMLLGPGPDILLLPDTGSVALHPSIALDPLLPQAAHVVWDNLLTLGSDTSPTAQTGAFYALAALPERL